MEETLFTKIINGTIACHKIYEDERTFAFLDIHPRQPGHTLVVPKNPVPFIWDLNDQDYAALTKTVKKIALHIREVMGSKYVAELISGLDVPHTHVQLFPFDSQDQYSALVDMAAEPDHQALAAIAKKLAF